MTDERTWSELSFSDQLSRLTKRGSASSEDVLGPDPNADVIAEMRHNRRINQRRTGNFDASSITFATGRPRDLMFYWRQNNLPYDYSKPEQLKQLRAICRMIYATHPIIGSAIDIFSNYPLIGMEFTSKDQAITDFYNDLFLDQLDYKEFLVDVGKEIWTVGEAWPFGSFNESLGVWEDDELLDPDNIEVMKSPFLKEPRFEMSLPESLRKILQSGEPKWEYQVLNSTYPELKNFLDPARKMPVSSILLRQLKFKGDTFNPRGIPILARGLRAVIQEEMLNAAQDAIADRLYTPLLLVKLGASATDLGTTQPWIPDEGDLASFEDLLDAALAADFRALVHHFAVKMESVFGRENMPRLEADFDRLTDRQLQIFGLSRTMLTGAGQGETYAADAINRDLISQLLSVHQRRLGKFVEDRCRVVAEAQQHYDFEERGGKRYPIMEEIVEVDEETGEMKIVEVPKLLVPELHFKAMNFRDEQDQRQFLEALREDGVPISMKTRLVNIPIDFDDEVQQVREEQVQLAIEAQEVRKETFQRLDQGGLPIPEDLEEDFRARPIVDGSPNGKAEEEAIPTLGIVEPADTMGLVPTSEDLGEDETAEGEMGLDGESNEYQPNVQRLPRNRTRPPESDEMRAEMPKPAYRLRTVAEREVEGDDGEKITEVEEQWMEFGPEGPEEGEWIPEGPNRLMSGPSHIGARKYARLDPDVPLDEQLVYDDE